VGITRASLCGPEAGEWEWLRDEEWLSVPIETRTPYDNQALARDLLAALDEGANQSVGAWRRAGLRRCW